MVKGKALVAVLLFVMAAAVLAILSGLGRRNEFVPVAGDLEKEVEASEPEQVVEVRSGDGKMSLIRKSLKLGDGSISYSFKVVNNTDNSEKDLFSKTVSPGVTIEIPSNSWSPDNKQLFVEEKNVGVTNYFVYKANGEKYGDFDYLNVNEYWVKSKNNYKIRVISGWEGNDLLSVKTTNEDGTNGPSFWFVISSRGFLRLRS